MIGSLIGLGGHLLEVGGVVRLAHSEGLIVEAASDPGSVPDDVVWLPQRLLLAR